MTLTINHRAANDAIYSRMLEITAEGLDGPGRNDRLDVEWAVRQFLKHVGRQLPNEVIPTHCWGANKQVDETNNHENSLLCGEAETGRMRVAKASVGSGGLQKIVQVALAASQRQDTEGALRRLGIYARAVVQLKVGTQAMFIIIPSRAAASVGYGGGLGCVQHQQNCVQRAAWGGGCICA